MEPSKKIMKRQQMSLTSSSSNNKNTSLFKKVRRSTRPIAEKASKAVRLQQETALAAEHKQAALSRLDAERVKRLQKLASRHEAAGRTADAAATREQIDAIMLQ